ncbi:MAG: MarR family transcriptional regulator [Thermincola sp.]|nr:MarR family transcriptional regulator [Thermincola sp.]MDT3703783.1 MarR family transcriptional regulator [Thermincola sp.]
MFDLEACVAFITNQCAKNIADSFNERLKSSGVTRVQWIALYYLGKHEGINQRELAAKMDVKGSSVVRLIDRMERDGYVERVKSPGDRRSTSLLLTEKGKTFREKLIPEGERMNKIVSKNICEEDLKTFVNVLKIMEDNIK